MPEEILEQGTVTGTTDGLATVSVVRSGSCDACSARIFCKSSGEENPQVIARNPLGARPGDRVRISAPGKSVLLASTVLYGIPLLLLLVGIALGAALFPYDQELYGSLLGIAFCALYYGIVRKASGSERQRQRFMPRIDKII